MTSTIDDLASGVRPDNPMITVMATADNERHAIGGLGEPWCNSFVVEDQELVDTDEGITCIRCLAVLVAEAEVEPEELARYIEANQS